MSTYRVTFADHGERDGAEVRAESKFHAFGKALAVLFEAGVSDRALVGRFYVVNMEDASDALGEPL